MPRNEEDVEKEMPEFREAFFSKYADSVSSGAYDARDVERLRSDDAYAKCWVRSFGDIGDPERPPIKCDEAFRFRKEIELNDLTEDSFPKELKEKDVIYWKGVNNKGQKILHFMVVRNKKGYLAEETKKYITWTLEQHHRQNPGERIVLIFDFTDAGVTNMDLDVVKYIIHCLTNYFPCLLAYILLFEMPWLLSSIWKVIRAWLNEEQKRMIQLVKKADMPKYIEEDQLLPHMKK